MRFNETISSIDESLLSLIMSVASGGMSRVNKAFRLGGKKSGGSGAQMEHGMPLLIR